MVESGLCGGRLQWLWWLLCFLSLVAVGCGSDLVFILFFIWVFGYGFGSGGGGGVVRF